MLVRWCVGVLVCWCVGVWVCGCVGVWVCGCVGVGGCVGVCGCVWVWACVIGEALRHTDICELLDERRHVEEGLVTPDSIVPVFFILELFYYFLCLLCLCFSSPRVSIVPVVAS